ncbi:MAG: hypothetical protein Q7K29_00310 [Thermoleophilia bacterium]|nr:hypothetical protein [Thermoleophilia bacterium]
MSAIEDIKSIAAVIDAELKEKKGVWTMKAVIAERKAFLSKKKLEYIARFRVDDEAKTIRFSEMLKESGSGISSGGGIDSDMSPGFGFKKETYKTGAGPREGTIEEQSTLFGKQYEYRFDFKEIRGGFEKIAADNGYSFSYSITPAGI